VSQGVTVAVIVPVPESDGILVKFRDDYEDRAPHVDTAFIFAAGGPDTIETAEDVLAAEQGVVRSAVNAAQGGVGAIVVACFSDPGVSAASHAVDVPVLGEGSSSLAAAGAMFRQFSVLCASSSTIAAKRQMAETLGVGSMLRAVVGMDIPVPELTASRAGVVADLVQREAEAGSQAVILGCTGIEPGFTSAVRGILADRGGGVVVVDPADVAGRSAIALASATRGPA
jgi:allantoin racemase